MSEMKKCVSFACPHDLAIQIEEKFSAYGGKYTVNEHSMEKFGQVYDFFNNLADNNDGDITCLDIQPESVNARIEIEVPPLDLYRDWMKKFVEILQYMDVLDIKPSEFDGIMIGATVNDVWEVA